MVSFVEMQKQVLDTFLTFTHIVNTNLNVFIIQIEQKRERIM